MSTYAVSVSTSSSSAVKMTIVPSSTFQVRIARVEAFGLASGSGGSTSYSVNVYPASTPTGGSALTPLPMAGGPASTATVKSGTTISGTNTLLHSEAAFNGDTSGLVGVYMNSNYTFPFELILSSGSALLVTAANSVGASNFATTIVVYYEEIRTPRTL